MRALLLAAGLGTRLRPITDRVPKCLVPVRGRPLLAYWLDHLFAAGFERVLVNTHYRAEQVEAFLATRPERDRIDTVHEEMLLGTGGTILANAGYFGGADFLVAHADNLTDFDIAGFLAAHDLRPAGCAITMLTFTTDAPRSCGIVELDGAGRVVAFHEKVADPPGNNANAAVYIVTSEVLRFLDTLGKPVIDFSTEAIPAFIGRIRAVPTLGYHRDIGSVDSLRLAEAEFPGRAARNGDRAAGVSAG